MKSCWRLIGRWWEIIRAHGNGKLWSLLKVSETYEKLEGVYKNLMWNWRWELIVVLRSYICLKVWWQDATLLVYFSYFTTYIHSITIIQYIYPSPFTEVSLHLLIAWKLSRKNLPVVPSRESNSGLPYSMPTRFQLSHTAPWISHATPCWATPHHTEPRRTITEPRRTMLSHAAP